jgi:hypothetical protein
MMTRLAVLTDYQLSGAKLDAEMGFPGTAQASPHQSAGELTHHYQRTSGTIQPDVERFRRGIARLVC